VRNETILEVLAILNQTGYTGVRRHIERLLEQPAPELPRCRDCGGRTSMRSRVGHGLYVVQCDEAGCQSTGPVKFSQEQAIDAYLRPTRMRDALDVLAPKAEEEKHGMATYRAPSTDPGSVATYPPTRADREQEAKLAGMREALAVAVSGGITAIRVLIDRESEGEAQGE
jgi:hypothetical protein